MNIPQKKINEYLCEKKIVTVPQIQADFELSYADARGIVSEMVESGALKYGSGLEFEVDPQFIEKYSQEDKLKMARGDLERRRAELLARMQQIFEEVNDEEEDEEDEDFKPIVEEDCFFLDDDEDSDEENDEEGDDDDMSFDDEEEEDPDDRALRFLLRELEDESPDDEDDEEEEDDDEEKDDEDDEENDETDSLGKYGITPRKYYQAVEYGMQRAKEGLPFMTTSLQRKFGWSFPQAAEVYDRMDQDGFLVRDPNIPWHKTAGVTEEQLAELKKKLGIK